MKLKDVLYIGAVVAGIVVWAYTSFASIQYVDKINYSFDSRLERIEDLQITMMTEQGIKIPPVRKK